MRWEPVEEKDDELARRVIGAGIEVHKVLGPGFLEAVYKKAMEYELRTSGLSVEREKEILVPYKDIQIAGQRLPATQRILIEVVVLGQLVVRAYDRRVAADVAVADELTIEHRDALDTVIAREVVRGRQSVPAGADDHDIVGLLE